MSSNRRGYFERDGNGRARVVIPGRARSSSRSDKTTRELLNESEDREQDLAVQVSSLQTRLSFAERNEWQMRQRYEALVNQHHQCRNLEVQLDAQVREVRRLDDLLADEEDKTERYKGKVDKLEEKIRLLKRGIVEDYRGKYDSAMRDVELLTQRLGEKNDQIRLADTRIASKDRTILHLKDYLHQLGYRVSV